MWWTSWRSLARRGSRLLGIGYIQAWVRPKPFPIAAPAAGCMFTVPASDRTFTVPASDRTFTVPASGRGVGGLMKTFRRHVGDVEAFGGGWVDWLGDADTLKTATWTVPAGISKLSDTTSDTVTTIALSMAGCEVGESFDLRVDVESNAGRKEHRYIRVVIIADTAENE